MQYGINPLPAIPPEPGFFLKLTSARQLGKLQHLLRQRKKKVDRKLFGTLLAYTALLLYLSAVIAVLSPFVRSLLWAAIIGTLTFPLYDRLYVAFKKRRNLTAGIMTPVVMMVLVIPVVALIFALANKGPAFYATIERTFSGDPAGIWQRIKTFPPLALLLESIGPLIDRMGIDLQESMKLSFQRSLDLVVGLSTTIVKKSLSFTLQLAVMALTLFFIYRDGKSFMTRLTALVPLEGKIQRELTYIVQNVLAKILYGLFLSCVTQGLMATLGYWMAGVSFPLLLGAATAAAALIPLLGTALVWVPATLYLLLQGQYFQGVFLFVWGGVLIAPSDNLIRTLFMSGRAGRIYIPPLVILLGLLGGLSVFGFIGIVLGPLILSLLFSVLELFTRESPETRPTTHP